MNNLTLYKNSKPYPYYSASLTKYKEFTVTPVNQNLRSGYVNLQLSLEDILEFNYLSYSRGGKTVYAWVTDVVKLGGALLYQVSFEIDAFRTYKGDLVLGTQFIVRSPAVTKLPDPFLGSTQEYNDMTVNAVSIGNPAKRYAVVQLRRPTGEVFSRVPGQPSPYQFWICEYDVNNWTGTTAITSLLAALESSAQSTNVVTIYSIPYVDLTLPYSATMNIQVGTTWKAITGWKLIGEGTSPLGKFRSKVSLIFDYMNPDLTLTDHSVSLIIPDAGVLTVPDEIIYGNLPVLIREIDIFSGSCNYHLALEDGLKMTPYSVRGSALSTIPILSDPYDTYISQNQNNIASSILGDTAMLVGGGLAAAYGSPAGMGAAAAGAQGLMNTMVTQRDASNMIPTNPPAFLGSALVGSHNNTFYEVVIRKPYDNAAAVHTRYGYPYHKLAALTIPSSGYIQTLNCSVSSSGEVPLWAINEINQLFDRGLLF